MSNSAGGGPDKKPQKPTMARYALWIIVGGVALVLIAQGIIGILAGGS
jgi:hypothetical protein